MRPGPMARTLPSWGFSLAVSGMTRPEAVVVSASLAWTRILSSSGLMFTLTGVTSTVVESVGRYRRRLPPRRRGGRGGSWCRATSTLPMRVPTRQPTLPYCRAFHAGRGRPVGPAPGTPDLPSLKPCHSEDLHLRHRQARIGGQVQAGGLGAGGDQVR